MLSLPELRLGERKLRLPLSPPGTVDVANAWLTADAGERQLRWRMLLRREPGLALWMLVTRGAASPPWCSFEELADAVPHVLLNSWAAEGATATGTVAGSTASSGDLSPVDGSVPVEGSVPAGGLSTTGDALAAGDWEQLAVRAEARARAADAESCTGGAWVARWLGDWISLVTPSVGEGKTGDTSSESLGELAQEIQNRWRASLPALDLAALARRLAEQRRLQEEGARQREIEKLAALREFAYGASHEINNPLANIATRAQTLLRDEVDEERRRSLAVIASQALRAHAMIADVMLFAKPPALRCAPVSLPAVLDRVIREVETEARGQRTVVRREGADPLWISADGEQLAVAVRALVENSLQALGQGGTVVVAAECRLAGDACRLVVRDTGPGIPAAVRRHLFDPYYSGREAGRGLGVGLCKAWRIITDHGGRIEVENLDGGGVEFVLELPGRVADKTLSFENSPGK